MFKSLKFKVSLPVFVAILVIAAATGVVFLRNLKQFYQASLIEEEGRTLLFAARTMPDSLYQRDQACALQEYCAVLGASLKQRVTFIDTHGTVQGDSYLDSASIATVENHGNRPEIQGLARSGTANGYGHAVRFSETVGMRMLYIAAPIVREGVTCGYLRFATPLKNIESYLHGQVIALLLLAMAAFLVIAFTVYYYSHSAQNVIREIGESARRIERAGPRQWRYRGFSLETDRLYDFIDETAVRLQTLIRDLVAQREEFRALLDSVPEGVVAVDSRFILLFANDNACRLFGSTFTSGSVPLVSLAGFTHAQEFQEIAAASLGASRRIERTVAFRGPGRVCDLKTVCTPLFQEFKSGERVVLLTFVDITEEKRLVQAKAEFVEAASHELRTPLTVLKGYVETLDESADPAFLRQCHQKIKQSVSRLENLTADLLQLSYLESGKANIIYKNMDLKQCVDEIINDLAGHIQEKGLIVSADCSCTIRSVPELAYIALYNLISNAVKYNTPGGRIIIRSATSASLCEISVIDSGVGIAYEYRDKVFERFFRVDRHRSRETGGTGLGLAIVKHIANTLKGAVRIEDGMDGGVAFVLRLPQENS
ncbi:MAG: hypothetical protein A2268_12340 [Candidatus Raymondbacteria bacterium RifOxyA12_full_50_37]|uniref:histidine kinase n=1 Tax=Candidatus Raymondbacteria bacterium RIFOXYD12_FULL_49_13 TaxID=1817890 RepID=A0A1F7F8E1_UNCRA|nr:MAG: hypothetical protein A2268_12340 [Candidatus Raymondbacteria bacterium RifOxyA12_full_50_37]OGJ91331.1 MAG: hypothetical protein A2248_03835 [Candidatus Raymondbacteria bacterium RIFOXYA2_FULL_49_16]OGJ97764.1 MAG: hypothetical protein A2453_13885 [Candidatus Raymondbacteria bacterium RIFOXYC2_FULL_50_21]OGK02925.1 MAG: hypothetical protein A2519_06240 [Candidatus Raymondbacteria bacterium RIFOXYD12_FULL_49_13]OGP43720.1 MAG: hypothetical protein A2324_15400 [Candidatus Raymondbacteria 